LKTSTTTSYIFATGFGCGYIPKIPGTVGSLLAVILVWFFPQDSIMLFSISIILIVIGIPTSTIVERHEGKDSGKIVIDEIAGQILTFIFIPLTGINLVLGFVLFRIFDIWKPFPINQSQKLAKGWGIMVDDVLAAVYANIILQLLNL
jgi:phosphatidylglycerophosphatase A